MNIIEILSAGISRSFTQLLFVFNLTLIGISCDNGNPITTEHEFGTMTDIDGNSYKTIKIGNQEWMAENLRTTRYNDGSAILLVTDDSAWQDLIFPELGGYCYYNNITNSEYIKKYGALYNWYACKTGKIAPVGWHAPDSIDWNILETYLIANGYNWDKTTTGNKIAKAMAAKTDWNSSINKSEPGNSQSSNNSSGFSGLPSGYRFYTGNSIEIGRQGCWWSTSESDVSHAYYRSLYYQSYELYHGNIGKNCGFSVRLVKDSTLHS